MRIIKKITPESKQAEDPNQKNQKITILDQQGRFSSELRIDKESIEPVSNFLVYLLEHADNLCLYFFYNEKMKHGSTQRS